MFMKILLKKFFSHKKSSELYALQKEKDKILTYLKELQRLEGKLWGVDINFLKNGEEHILDDTNHLIYMFSRGHHDKLSKVLANKNVKSFMSDLENIRKDFNILKKDLRDKERLKLLISNFTIKLVDAKNYNKFKDVFLLEKRLYEVLDRQDVEFSMLLQDVSKIKVDTKSEELDLFVASIKKVREILAGHLDNIKFFEEDRHGFSNTSNLIHELISIFSQDLE